MPMTIRKVIRKVIQLWEVSQSGLKMLYWVTFMKTGCCCFYLAILCTQFSDHFCISSTIGQTRHSHHFSIIASDLRPLQTPQGWWEQPSSPEGGTSICLCLQSVLLAEAVQWEARAWPQGMSPSALDTPPRRLPRVALDTAPSTGQAPQRGSGGAWCRWCQQPNHWCQAERGFGGCASGKAPLPKAL